MLKPRLKVSGVIIAVSLGLVVRDAGRLLAGWLEMFVSTLASAGFVAKIGTAQAAGGALFKSVFLLVPRLVLALVVLTGRGGTYVPRLIPEAVPYVREDLLSAEMID